MPMLPHTRPAALLILCALILITAVQLRAQIITGELRQWHRITLSFEGPDASETGDTNPFADYRLEVTLSHAEDTVVVPGYFAADGHAAETGASGGNMWRAHFAPHLAGAWNYSVICVAGEDVAISGAAGEPVAPHGISGAFEVGTSDKLPPDNRARGRLQYVHQRYLRFAGTGDYFLKIGADAPETFLAYTGFDSTTMQDGGSPLKDWSPHVADWKPGDPVWRDDRGKGIIGAINYLASEGQNAISFLTMNIDGDGRNVWPYLDPATRDRFDCSKLDQWEIVFDHADRNGMYLHFKTQETENDQLLDGGALGRERKLYYREMI
ncbi:MAG: DUF5060 domain-containing protein, partial [Saprospiraceae bacterium]|nr:DUF5060 domain-containing protein [Saprospiraceae bacterium]